jgi:hypothetical protein
MMGVKSMDIEVLDNGFILSYTLEDERNGHWQEKREIATTEGKLIRRIKELINSKPKDKQLLIESSGQK